MQSAACRRTCSHPNSPTQSRAEPCATRPRLNIPHLRSPTRPQAPRPPMPSGSSARARQRIHSVQQRAAGMQQARQQAACARKHARVHGRRGAGLHGRRRAGSRAGTGRAGASPPASLRAGPPAPRAAPTPRRAPRRTSPGGRSPTPHPRVAAPAAQSPADARSCPAAAHPRRVSSACGGLRPAAGPHAIQHWRRPPSNPRPPQRAQPPRPITAQPRRLAGLRRRACPWRARGYARPTSACPCAALYPPGPGAAPSRRPAPR